jgi:hypothetical protein
MTSPEFPTSQLPCDLPVQGGMADFRGVASSCICCGLVRDVLIKQGRGLLGLFVILCLLFLRLARRSNPVSMPATAVHKA